MRHKKMVQGWADGWNSAAQEDGTGGADGWNSAAQEDGTGGADGWNSSAQEDGTVGLTGGIVRHKKIVQGG